MRAERQPLFRFYRVCFAARSGSAAVVEKELNRMKELFEKRNDSRDKIIEQRLKELKGEEESLF